jgi:hypothetical protein
MSLRELFDGVSKKLKIDFEEQAKLLGHPGEVGSGRENVLKNILVKYLPKRYGVDSGFVIDALGNKSEQIDIVIYEADYTPVFEIVDGKKFFPCETVVTVGQVRTGIGSREAMQECLGNINSVKRLDRSNNKTNELITGPGVSLKGLPPFDPDKNFRDQIFGFVFCSSSMKPDTMVAELQAFNKRSEKKLWINTIVNYNEFLIEYANYDQGYLTQDPMVAQKISLIPIKHNPEIFALFISILNNFLNVAHIARPNLFAYCKIDAVEHNDYELMSTEEQ